VHVTLRARQGLPSLRQQVVHALLLRILNRQRKRSYGEAFRILHFSIQSNHLHLVLEAADGPLPAPSTRKKNPLRSGVSGFAIAFARRLNALLRRKGKVWAERYHRHDLTTPREVRNALRYVLQNHRKHGFAVMGTGAFDPLSSAQHFDGWSEPLFCWITEAEPWPAVGPRTWLLAKGWKRSGLISPEEAPVPARVRVSAK
jgi:putative transposase